MCCDVDDVVCVGGGVGVGGVDVADGVAGVCVVGGVVADVVVLCCDWRCVWC